MGDVITKQTNNDGSECIVYDNGNGSCTVVVGKRPRIRYTIKVKKDKLAYILRQIKEGEHKCKAQR